MPSIGTLGSTLPLGPKSLKVKHQAFPQGGSMDWSCPLQPACMSQITITGLEPGVQLNVASRSENFLVDTGVTYFVLTSSSRAFSPQTCTILGATGKPITKIFTQALLCCWDGQTFSHQFLVVSECPTPLLGRNLSLPSKSCSYCSPDGRCFKILFWGQAILPATKWNTSWMEESIYDVYQRILRYQVVLMENPGLTISPCEIHNPATLLPTPEGSLPFHSCLETLDHWIKPWEGLSEDPLTNLEEIWYTEGSSFVLDGKRRARYVVVSSFETVEAKPLPPGTSAQLAKLIALYISPLLPSPCVQKTALYVSSFYPAHIFISTIFLDSIYIYTLVYDI